VSSSFSKRTRILRKRLSRSDRPPPPSVAVWHRGAHVWPAALRPGADVGNIPKRFGLLAAGGKVVALVRTQMLGLLGRWRRSSITTASSVSASNLISCRLAPATTRSIGMPFPSVSRLRLVPRLPRSVGLGAVAAPLKGLWSSLYRCSASSIPTRGGHRRRAAPAPLQIHLRGRSVDPRRPERIFAAVQIRGIAITPDNGDGWVDGRNLIWTCTCWSRIRPAPARCMHERR
jgi:hypothetical protein